MGKKAGRGGDQQGKQNTVCSRVQTHRGPLIKEKSTGEEGARVRAEKQSEDLVQGLLRVGRKQGQGWKAKQITFVGGTCGSVNVTSFEENLKELQVLELKWGKMRADLARKLLEEQDTVFRQYYETKWGNGDGGSGRASAGGREHVGRDVYIVIGRE